MQPLLCSTPTICFLKVISIFVSCLLCYQACLFLEQNTNSKPVFHMLLLYIFYSVLAVCSFFWSSSEAQAEWRSPWSSQKHTTAYTCWRGPPSTPSALALPSLTPSSPTAASGVQETHSSKSQRGRCGHLICQLTEGEKALCAVLLHQRSTNQAFILQAEGKLPLGFCYFFPAKERNWFIIIKLRR